MAITNWESISYSVIKRIHIKGWGKELGKISRELKREVGDKCEQNVV